MVSESTLTETVRAEAVSSRSRGVFSRFENLGQGFVADVAATYTTQVFLAGISMLISVLAARLLGPAGRGEYAVAMTLGLIGIQFGNLGLQTSNTYYLARDITRLPGLLANSILVSAIVGGILMLAAACIMIIRPALLPVHGALLGLALLWTPVGLAYLLAQNLFVAMGQIRAFNLIECANKVLTLSIIGVVVFVGHVSPAGILGAGACALICVAVFSVSLQRRFVHGPIRPSWTLFRNGIGLGMRSYLSCFLSFLLLRIGLLMVKYILGASAAGYYSVASNMSDYILLLPSAIATLLFPRLAAITDPHGKWKAAVRIIRAVGLVILPLMIGCAVLSRPLIAICFGPAYAPARDAFLVMLPGVLCLGIETVAVQYLASSGFPFSVVAAWAFTCVFNIAFNLWSIPRFGIRGAAATSSICYVLMLFMVLGIIYRHKSRIEPGEISPVPAGGGSLE